MVADKYVRVLGASSSDDVMEVPWSRHDSFRPDWCALSAYLVDDVVAALSTNTNITRDIGASLPHGMANERGEWPISMFDGGVLTHEETASLCVRLHLNPRTAVSRESFKEREGDSVMAGAAFYVVKPMNNTGAWRAYWRKRHRTNRLVAAFAGHRASWQTDTLLLSPHSYPVDVILAPEEVIPTLKQTVSNISCLVSADGQCLSSATKSR